MIDTQELLDKEADLSNQLYALRKQIRNQRNSYPPSCFGLDDCSTDILSRCPYRFDCGPDNVI